MTFDEKDIIYPPVHPGTDRTFIRFYKGEPDLNAIFFPELEDESQKNDSRPQRVL